MNKQSMLTLLFTYSIIGKISAVHTLYVNLGEKAVLQCPLSNATWTGPPRSDILAVGMDLAKGMSSIFSVTNLDGTSILAIKKFTTSNAGLYYCYNYVSNYSYHVHANLAPTNMRIKNLSKSGELIVQEYSDFILECSVIPDQPKVLLQWTKENKVLIQNYTDTINFTLNSTFQDDNTIFECQAYKEKKNVLSTQVVLKVKVQVPSKLLDVQLVAFEEKIFVRWKPGQNKSHAPQTYTIEYRKYEENDFMTLSDIRPTSVYIKQLEPDTIYYFKLYAVNPGGRGQMTPEYIVKTEASAKILPFILTGCASFACAVLCFFIIYEVFKKRRCSYQDDDSGPISNTVLLQSGIETIRSGVTTHYDEIENMQIHSGEHLNQVVEASESHLGASCNEVDISNEVRSTVNTKLDQDSSGYLTPLCCNDQRNKTLMTVNMVDSRNSTSSSDASQTGVKTDCKYEMLGEVNQSEHNYRDIGDNLR